MRALICQHCGETFAAKRSHAKWCSDKCSKLARGKILGERSFQCEHCAKDFLATRSDAKWCSGKCAKASDLKSSAEKRNMASQRACKWGAENPEKRRKNLQNWVAKNRDKNRENKRNTKNKRRRMIAEAQAIEFIITGDLNYD